MKRKSSFPPALPDRLSCLVYHVAKPQTICSPLGGNDSESGWPVSSRRLSIADIPPRWMVEVTRTMPSISCHARQAGQSIAAWGRAGGTQRKGRKGAGRAPCTHGRGRIGLHAPDCGTGEAIPTNHGAQLPEVPTSRRGLYRSLVPRSLSPFLPLSPSASETLRRMAARWANVAGTPNRYTPRVCWSAMRRRVVSTPCGLEGSGIRVLPRAPQRKEAV